VARPDQVLIGVTTVVLTVVAILLAMVGGFLSPSEPRVLHVPIPVGVLVAIVGNLVVGIGGAWGTGTRLTPAVTGFVWLVVAFLLGTNGPGGDLIVSGNGWLGVSYLFLGAIAAAAAIGVGPDGVRSALRSGLRSRRAQPSLEADLRR
jgi:hypothetical protein